MAIIEREEPLELEAGDTVETAERPLGALTRPQGSTGWKSWLFTVDHKRIGIMYGAAGILFFVIGGIYALFIRLQLAVPDGNVLSADTYNQVYTMHGVVMVFLAAIPLGAAFSNYLHTASRSVRVTSRSRASTRSASGVFLGGWSVHRVVDVHRRLVGERPRWWLVRLRAEHRRAVLAQQGASTSSRSVCRSRVSHR